MLKFLFFFINYCRPFFFKMVLKNLLSGFLRFFFFCCNFITARAVFLNAAFFSKLEASHVNTDPFVKAIEDLENGQQVCD